MYKFIAQLIFIFLVALIGGIFGSQIVWPLFIERPLFYQYHLPQIPTYVSETKEVIVQENVALQEAVDRVKKTIVAVESRGSEGQVLRRGSGFVLTSDGLMVTLNELLPKGAVFIFLVDGKPSRYQVLKRDYKLNLALVKLEEKDLPTAPFADSSNIRLGERIFLVGANMEQVEQPEKNGIIWERKFFVNEGIVRKIREKEIVTSIKDKFADGAGIFNIEGQLLGLAFVDSSYETIVIPSSVVRSFSGM